ncbi:MAG: hypothetical protein Q8K20_12020 [Gemmobacter sp.]|nr:hypothetical protein [Gemmobacter sp.]
MSFGENNATATSAREADLGVPEIVVKDGTRSTLCLAHGRTGELHVEPVARPVDTTGAETVFNGPILLRDWRVCGTTFLFAKHNTRVPVSWVIAAP